MIIVQELSDDQDIGAVAVGAEPSTDVWDSQVADRNIGEGTQILAYASVGNEAVTSAGAALVQFKLEHSDDDSSFVDLLVIEPIAVASLTIGAEIFKGALPAKTNRYIRASYTVAVNNLSAGFVNCHLGVA